ncbi:MAG TPA: sensor histidine kinase [Streptosporangiaceae bacterium]
MATTDTRSKDKQSKQERKPGLVRTALGLDETGASPAVPSPRHGLDDSRLGNATRWVFAAVWLVYLIQPISDLFGHRHSALWTAGGLAITAAFCVVYAPLVSMTSGLRTATACRGLVAVVVLAGLACVIYGSEWTSLWIYVAAAVGIVLPGVVSRKWTMLGVLGVGILYSIFSWISHDGWEDWLVVLLPVLLIGYAMVGMRIQFELMHELKQARETVAKLAASEERLRLARDMHDLTGQSLSTITLKSELAAKRLSRLPEGAERDAIAGELADIGQVSRQTLHDIREAVSGYRRPTLAIETITARTTLEAAGIALDDDPNLITRSGTFDPDAEAALAWCLREAVTNVVRHSAARTCELRLTENGGEISLRVADDGRGFASGGGTDGGGADGGGTGNGLRNMSERLSAVGGSLAMQLVRSSPPRGFRLTATVPVIAGPCPRETPYS